MNREELIFKIKNLNQIYKWNEAKQRKKDFMYDYIREWKREWYEANITPTEKKNETNYIPIFNL